MDPYPPLLSAIRTQKEHVKIAIEVSLPTVGSNEDDNDNDNTNSNSNGDLDGAGKHNCILAVISNVERGFEECCIFVCKRRRKDANQIKIIDAMAIGSDFQATIQQSPSLRHSSGSTLQLIMTSRGKSVSGLSSDSQGIKDLVAVARDAAKTLSNHPQQPSHAWLQQYIEATPSSGSGTSTADVPIFSRFTSSSVAPVQTVSNRPRPPSPTEKEIRVSIGTFNVNGQMPGETDLNTWLHLNEDEPDILVVGLQEAESSNLSYVVWTPYVEDAWREGVEKSMGIKADEYELLASKQLVGILLLVYVRKEISPRITSLATSSVGVGFGGWAANKGATAIRFDLDDALPVCFVVSHLSAFDSSEARERRRWDYGEIVKRLRFTLIEMEGDGDEGKVSIDGALIQGGEKVSRERERETGAQAMLRAQLERNPIVHTDTQADVSWAADDSQQFKKRHLAIMDHDVVFWLGDLNWRLELGIGEVKRLIQQRKFESALLSFDQLRSEMQAKTCFQGFQEQKIGFAPTYKFDRNSDQYDTSEKKRVPSWTDRILWKQEGNHVKPVHYESCPSIQISDHRPVLATFLLTVDKEGLASSSVS